MSTTTSPVAGTGSGASPTSRRPTAESTAAFMDSHFRGGYGGQVALPADFRISKEFDPAAKLLGTRLRDLTKSGNCHPLVNGQPLLTHGNGEHRPHFARRASCDIQESQELAGRTAFESFRDVVRDRKHRPLELIPKASTKQPG